MYNKPTFCGVSFVFALLFRTFSIVSDFSRFYSQVCPLKDILEKNPFPIKLIDSCIKNFLSKRLTEKPVKLTAKKKSSIIVLPFLAKLSLDLRTLLKNSFSKNLSFCKIRAIFKCSTRVFNFAQFKVKMLYCLRSNVVQKFSCGRCNAIYYAETCQYFSNRVGEHSGVSPLTGQSPKSLQQ